MSEERDPEQLTLAAKLDQLFKAARPRASGEFTYDEVAAGINALGGETISPAYLHELRTGKKDNPRKRHLDAIARFFDVPSSYLLEDGEAAARIHAELRLQAAMQDNEIQRIALRASNLSPATLHAVAQIIEQARQIEGLDDGEGAHQPMQERREQRSGGGPTASATDL